MNQSQSPDPRLKEPHITSEPTPPERNLPISQMSPVQLSGYRHALEEYLRHAPQHAERYTALQAWLADVRAEQAIRKIIDNHSRQAKPGHERPRPVRDWIRRGPGRR